VLAGFHSPERVKGKKKAGQLFRAVRLRRPASARGWGAEKSPRLGLVEITWLAK
jgi:hypothetical protein